MGRDQRRGVDVLEPIEVGDTVGESHVQEGVALAGGRGAESRDQRWVEPRPGAVRRAAAVEVEAEVGELGARAPLERHRSVAGSRGERLQLHGGRRRHGEGERRVERRDVGAVLEQQDVRPHHGLDGRRRVGAGREQRPNVVEGWAAADRQRAPSRGVGLGGVVAPGEGPAALQVVGRVGPVRRGLEVAPARPVPVMPLQVGGANPRRRQLHVDASELRFRPKVEPGRAVREGQRIVSSYSRVVQVLGRPREASVREGRASIELEGAGAVEGADEGLQVRREVAVVDKGAALERHGRVHERAPLPDLEQRPAAGDAVAVDADVQARRGIEIDLVGALRLVVCVVRSEGSIARVEPAGADGEAEGVRVDRSERRGSSANGVGSTAICRLC